MHQPLVRGGLASASARRRPQSLLFTIAMLLVAGTLLSLATGSARAAGGNGVCGALNVPNPAGSVGTSGDPCLISSDADLDTAMAQINADTAHTGASTAYYELTTDLDYSKDSSNTTHAATANWNGIDWFSGTFNGNGHTISNLTYMPATDGFTATLPGSTALAASDVGFFRVLNDATVENLTLQNVHASGSTSNLAGAGVAVWSFASTVTGVTLADPAIASTGAGGNSYFGGLVGLAYSNAYADNGATTSDGGVSTFTDDAVSGGSLSAYNRLGGIAGLTKGQTNISDDYVNTEISNPAHPANGNPDYGQGGLVGWPSAVYGTSPGTAMTDNVISGSMTFQSATVRSSGATNYTSATVGYSNNSAFWTTSNDLVSSGFTFEDPSGNPLTGPGVTGADGVSVSPQTLATESTYSGTATGLTDSSTAATYNDLGWNFAAPDPSVWIWTGSTTSGTPVLVESPSVTLTSNSITGQLNTTQSASALASDAGASVSFDNPTFTAADVTWSVNGTISWGTAGSYPVDLVASFAGLSTSVPLTVVVSQSIVLQSSTYTVEASSNATSSATILTALGATLPPGSTGSFTIDLTGADPGDTAVDFDQPGSYTVTVSDTSAGDDLTPTTATIVVTSVPAVTVTKSTLYFNAANPPTAANVVSEAGAQLTDGSGNPLAGSVTASVPAAALAGTPGTYTATLTGTSSGGLTTPGTPVSVIVSGATLTVARTRTAIQQTTTTPSASAVLADLGATLSGSTAGTAAVDLTGADPGDDAVNFSEVGEYTVTVSDTDAETDVVAPITTTILIVPASVLNIANPTVYFNTAAPPTAAAVLRASGAELTNLNGDVVLGSLTASIPQGCGTSAGTCTATIAGTDSNGLAAAPATVTIDVSAAAVGVANATATFSDSGSAPSQAALISALGASVTGSTTGGGPAVDTVAVNWSVPGTYSVIVGDADPNDVAATVTATIRVVPQPVVALPSATVYLPASAADPLDASTLLANSGASLTDGDGNTVAGTLSADTSAVDGNVAGTYSATITGTDSYGLESAPVTVSVVIYVSGQQTGTVSVTGTPAVGATLTADMSGWAGLAVPSYQWMLNGVPIPGATSSTFVVSSADAGDNISVAVTEAPTWYQTTSATSGVVPIPGAASTETNQEAGSGASSGSSTSTTGSSGTGTSTTDTGATGTSTSSTGSDASPTTKTTFTPQVDVLKPGLSATTVVLKLPSSIKQGTKLTVAESEPGKSKAKTVSVKVAKAGQVRFATGKLPAGTTVIRFYQTVETKKKVDGKTKLVTTKKLVKTETVKVKAKAKKKPSLTVALELTTSFRSHS